MTLCKKNRFSHSEMILKILASVFTGIGGHYLNRRWDKAILFLCLFVLYWASVYLFLTDWWKLKF